MPMKAILGNIGSLSDMKNSIREYMIKIIHPAKTMKRPILRVNLEKGLFQIRSSSSSVGPENETDLSFE
jgi:hypothetical protein